MREGESQNSSREAGILSAIEEIHKEDEDRLNICLRQLKDK